MPVPSSTVMSSAGGGYLFTFQDVTEQKRLERDAELQKRLAAVGQMAAGIAHELNTPLTYIMGNLELLELQDLSGAQREMLSSIARGADRIRALAHRLLAFSRPAREEMTPLSSPTASLIWTV